MKPITTLFMLSILCLSLVPHQIVADDPAKSTNNLIEHACQRSRSRDFCVSSLASDPSSQHADLRGLASIAIKLAHKNATDLMDRIAVLANNDTISTDPAAQQGLYDCSDNYLDAAEQLENSLAALSENSYHDADVSNWVKAAIADAKSCEAAVEGLKFELSHQNRVFILLAKNAFATVQVLTG
jgi:pectinesterase inhibitor-like protein